MICATVTVEASEAVILLAEGGRNALIGCHFRAESRAESRENAAARAAPLRGAVFWRGLEAALAGRFVLTERLFMEQL